MAVLGRLFGTRAPFVPADEIDGMLGDGAVLLDVRTAQELEETGTIPGAIHIHLGELAERIAELPRAQPVLTT